MAEKNLSSKVTYLSSLSEAEKKEIDEKVSYGLELANYILSKK